MWSHSIFTTTKIILRGCCAHFGPGSSNSCSSGYRRLWVFQAERSKGKRWVLGAVALHFFIMIIPDNIITTSTVCLLFPTAHQSTAQHSTPSVGGIEGSQQAVACALLSTVVRDVYPSLSPQWHCHISLQPLFLVALLCVFRVEEDEGYYNIHVCY